ncbi:hypothetical protein V6N13_098846 [Hibiscus sabdariffa]
MKEMFDKLVSNLKQEQPVAQVVATPSRALGFNNLLEQDDKGDVSAETTGPVPVEVSVGTQISAERLLCYWLIPKSK